MKMKSSSIILTAFTAFGVSACGTYVPEIQDFGSETQSLIYVDDVTTSVSCEVRDAVFDLYKDYRGSDQISFLDNWGAQIDLTLIVNENGSVAPATQFFPLGQPKNWKFNWGVNATVSSSATRTETVSYFYPISELKRYHCPWRPNGAMLLENNLKFKEWLYDAVGLSITREASLPSGVATTHGVPAGGTKPTNVLTHNVTFVLTTSGGVTPQWALVNSAFIHVPVNFGRVRTNTMLVTLGPTAPAPPSSNDPKTSSGDSKKGTTLQLAPTALNMAQAQNTAIFITTTINNFNSGN
jgi:hypothetical protein